MAFIRTKKIKNNEYAYLVSSTWKKTKGGRQKVKQYLGRVHTFLLNDEPFVGKPEYKSRREIVQNLVVWELNLHGFKKQGNRIYYGTTSCNLEELTFDFNRRSGVIKMNEGFLCDHTLKQLTNFKLTGQRDEYRLANAFVDAGLRIPKDLFIEFWQSLIS